jgi:hypothetical protein
MSDETPDDRFRSVPLYAEPPARRYSKRTIGVLVITLASMVVSMVSAAYGWSMWITIALGVAAVAGFLAGKRLERMDRSTYGADRDSIAYRMKDWR